jgi:hypothetical protein
MLPFAQSASKLYFVLQNPHARGRETMEEAKLTDNDREPSQKGKMGGVG